jgi:hypothetical protein
MAIKINALANRFAYLIKTSINAEANRARPSKKINWKRLGIEQQDSVFNVLNHEEQDFYSYIAFLQTLMDANEVKTIQKNLDMYRIDGKFGGETFRHLISHINANYKEYFANESNVLEVSKLREIIRKLSNPSAKSIADQVAAATILSQELRADNSTIANQITAGNNLLAEIKRIINPRAPNKQKALDPGTYDEVIKNLTLLSKQNFNQMDSEIITNALEAIKYTKESLSNFRLNHGSTSGYPIQLRQLYTHLENLKLENLKLETPRQYKIKDIF